MFQVDDIMNNHMSNIFENLDRTDKCLAKHKMSKLEQEEIEGLNRSMTIEEAQIVSNTHFPKNLRAKLILQVSSTKLSRNRSQ